MNISARRCEISFVHFIPFGLMHFYQRQRFVFMNTTSFSSQYKTTFWVRIYFDFWICLTLIEKKGTKGTALDHLVAATSSKINVLLLIPTRWFLSRRRHVYQSFSLINFFVSPMIWLKWIQNHKIHSLRCYWLLLSICRRQWNDI